VDGAGRVVAERWLGSVAEVVWLRPIRLPQRPSTHLDLGLVGSDVDVVEGGLVVPVLVDRRDADLGIDGQDVGDGDLAWDIATLTARTEELAKRVGVEAIDDDASFAVVLDDFVVGIARTTTNDGRDAGSRATFDGQCVFTHVVPPYILNATVAVLTVHAFGLILPDDDVLQYGSWLDEEDGRAPPAFVLTRARDVGALVRLHLSIKDLACLDGDGCVLLDESLARGPGTRGQWSSQCGGVERGKSDEREERGGYTEVGEHLVLSGGWLSCTCVAVVLVGVVGLVGLVD
jgi:hypothetical protein